jgi:hypothetical protein
MVPIYVSSRARLIQSVPNFDVGETIIGCLTEEWANCESQACGSPLILSRTFSVQTGSPYHTANFS